MKELVYLVLLVSVSVAVAQHLYYVIEGPRKGVILSFSKLNSPSSRNSTQIEQVIKTRLSSQSGTARDDKLELKSAVVQGPTYPESEEDSEEEEGQEFIKVYPFQNNETKSWISSVKAPFRWLKNTQKRLRSAIEQEVAVIKRLKEEAKNEEDQDEEEEDSKQEDDESKDASAGDSLSNESDEESVESHQDQANVTVTSQPAGWLQNIKDNLRLPTLMQKQRPIVPVQLRQEEQGPTTRPPPAVKQKSDYKPVTPQVGGGTTDSGWIKKIQDNIRLPSFTTNGKRIPSKSHTQSTPLSSQAPKDPNNSWSRILWPFAGSNGNNPRPNQSKSRPPLPVSFTISKDKHEPQYHSPGLSISVKKKKHVTKLPPFDVTLKKQQHGHHGHGALKLTHQIPPLPLEFPYSVSLKKKDHGPPLQVNFEGAGYNQHGPKPQLSVGFESMKPSVGFGFTKDKHGHKNGFKVSVNKKPRPHAHGGSHGSNGPPPPFGHPQFNHFPPSGHGKKPPKTGYQGTYYSGWDLTVPFQGLSENDMKILHSKGFKKYTRKVKIVRKKLKKGVKLKKKLQKLIEKKLNKLEKQFSSAFWESEEDKH